VVEVVSPGSVRTDNVMKLDEYAEAGIEQYWVVDTDEPASITVHRLVDGLYQRCDETNGTLRVETPVPLTVDVTALVP
jgi:Uma2 family endonuclease